MQCPVCPIMKWRASRAEQEGRAEWRRGGAGGADKHSKPAGHSPWTDMSILSKQKMSLPTAACLMMGWTGGCGWGEPSRLLYEEVSFTGSTFSYFDENNYLWLDCICVLPTFLSAWMTNLIFLYCRLRRSYSLHRCFSFVVHACASLLTKMLTKMSTWKDKTQELLVIRTDAGVWGLERAVN